MHRLSVAKTEDTPKSEISTTPPPQLQKKRGWRKLSAEKIYEIDTLRPLTAVDGRPKQDQISTESDEADWEDSQADALTVQEWARQEGFSFPHPVAPPPIKHNVNQQIRRAMARRAKARALREKAPQTHYQRFDEGNFGQRIIDTPPSHSRRKSLLSAELIDAESGDEDSIESNRSQSSLSTAKQTLAGGTLPANELRRDSGYGDENNSENEDDAHNAEELFQYDFGQQDIVF
ncbi:hypothetical protein EG328_010300 [Venturia inaequalis]|uniref:Uncharacterized protein n=2 Tax=Venturia inaequalis TaxID=5025 RepID=A0A8H3Z4N1_VENIN|nr:hypothetical protein EG328_010300 [Venturia inaequalis]RDI89335.1 ATP-dependent RNA helicase [Venturia inaequalis]